MSIDAPTFPVPAAKASYDARSRATAVASRVLDLMAAVLLLVALFPVLLAAAAAIRLDSPGPVIFRQRRLGLGTTVFTVNKFRTMHPQASSDPHREYVLGLIAGDAGARDGGNGPVYKLVADDRVTRVGRFLRRWSIDELPQLWNVVRGEMSLVGPRPAIEYEVERYTGEWFQRFAVRPGLTGLWQVSGRSELSFRDMVQLDCEYARRRSLWLNLRILAKTPWAIVHGRGAA